MALISVSNNALSNITALPASIPTGALTLIKSITASASASISFVDGTDGVVLDGTYSSYIFKFINIKPELNDKIFEFQGSTNGGSTYGVAITSTSFFSAHSEADLTEFPYNTYGDLAQETSYQRINSGGGQGNGADENFCGELKIFNPSSTTYVKHFIIRGNEYNAGDYSIDSLVAGYFNTTSAVDAFQFKFNSGNIDDGIIKLYGVS